MEGSQLDWLAHSSGTGVGFVHADKVTAAKLRVFAAVDYCEFQYKTAVKKGTANPVWSESFSFPVGGAQRDGDRPVQIKVLSSHSTGPIEIGTWAFRLKELVSDFNSNMRGWVPLCAPAGGSVQGNGTEVVQAQLAEAEGAQARVRLSVKFFAARGSEGEAEQSQECLLDNSTGLLVLPVPCSLVDDEDVVDMSVAVPAHGPDSNSAQDERSKSAHELRTDNGTLDQLGPSISARPGGSAEKGEEGEGEGEREGGWGEGKVAVGVAPGSETSGGDGGAGARKDGAGVSQGGGGSAIGGWDALQHRTAEVTANSSRGPGSGLTSKGGLEEDVGMVGLGGEDDGDERVRLIELLKLRYVTTYLAFNEVRRWKGQQDVARVLPHEVQVLGLIRLDFQMV